MLKVIRPREDIAPAAGFKRQKINRRETTMAESQAATMEEIALKLWALRTQQGSWEHPDSPQPHRLAPLSIPQQQCEGRAAN